MDEERADEVKVAESVAWSLRHRMGSLEDNKKRCFSSIKYTRTGQRGQRRACRCRDEFCMERFHGEDSKVTCVIYNYYLLLVLPLKSILKINLKLYIRRYTAHGILVTRLIYIA